MGFDFTARVGGKSWASVHNAQGLHLWGPEVCEWQSRDVTQLTAPRGKGHRKHGRVTVEGPLELGDRALGSVLAGSLNNRVSSPASHVVPEHRAWSDFLSITE